jgi:hypothetical protein
MREHFDVRAARRDFRESDRPHIGTNAVARKRRGDHVSLSE